MEFKLNWRLILQYFENYTYLYRYTLFSNHRIFTYMPLESFLLFSPFELNFSCPYVEGSRMHAPLAKNRRRCVISVRFVTLLRQLSL